MKQILRQEKGWAVSSLLWVLVFLTLVFSGCDGPSGGGGGGGGGGNSPPPANFAPQIISVPVTTAIIDLPYIYTVEATDADGDTLAYSPVDFPEGMTIATTSGLINWVPDVADIGDHAIKVKVTDGTASVYQEYVLTVSLPPNHDPVITSTPVTTAVVGNPYQYIVTATDADADSLTCGLVTKPSGMTIGSASCLMAWTPTISQVGVHTVKVSVTDGKATVYQQYTLTVTAPPNNAPVITSPAVTTATSTVGYNYQVTATDADADSLTCGLVMKPIGMTIGSASCLIAWTPTTAQVGNFTVRVSVTDGKATVYQEYILTVAPPPNRAPVITTTAITAASTKLLYRYNFHATDPDGDTLVYSGENFPLGMNITATTGEITWIPAVGQGGNHTVTVIVSDGELSASQTFTIAVNNSPVFTSIPVTTLIVEQPYIYDADATDADGDSLTYSLYNSWPPGMVIDPVTGVVTWTPTMADEGSHSMYVKVSDGKGYAIAWYILDVRFANYAPYILSSPVLTAISGQIYNYKVNAADSDGDALTHFLANAPVGMIINDQTGQISYLPGYAQKGDQQVKVGVSDGKVTTYQDYTLTVSWPAGMELAFTSIPITAAFTNIAYIYQAQAVDVNGHALTFGVSYGPPGLSINSSSGLVAWTPAGGDVGNHWVEITVTDGSTSVSQFYTIRVSPTDNGIPLQHTCVFTTWWHEDLDGIKGESTMLRMHENGCDTVSIVITAYQASISATTIYTSVTKTPTDEGITHMTNFAHSLGMAVYFKVHVDIPSGPWRGYITFTTESDWIAWFASYDALMAHYLDLAESLGAEGFIIGTELKGTEHRESQWRTTIALGRSKFSGLMSYDANWDSYATVNWWDALDFIGISAYFPLTASFAPTVAQLNTAWLPWISALSAFSATWNMDIVFLELGYQSYNGTNTRPNEAPTGVPDLQEQLDCYQAAFESLYDEPWFKGMAWWMWYWDPAQNINGYDVYNKPAEATLRYWYAGY